MDHEFQLVVKLGVYIDALKVKYKKGGRRQLLLVLEHGTIKIDTEDKSEEFYSFDYYHMVTFTLPLYDYIEIMDDIDDISRVILQDLNKLQQTSDETYEIVRIQSDESTSIIPTDFDTTMQIESNWKQGTYRVFFSHKTENKTDVSKIKNYLSQFGFDCFVAHEDIEPSTAWTEEIKKAIRSSDALVAFLTPNFRDSLWTDQEVGYAFFKGIPTLPVALGTLPQGFLGTLQAIKTDWENAGLKILEIILQKDNKAVDSFVTAFKNCSSFAHGEALSSALPYIKSLSEEHIQILAEAYNSNSQISGCFKLNGNSGPGLLPILKKHSKKHIQKREGKIIIS